MTEAEVLSLINEFIVANGNNEITANVLRPILVAMLEQPNDKVGELSALSTTDKSNIVNAINEVLNEANSGFEIHAGTADPNVTPPATYAVGDWYIRNGVSLYQYNGSTWVLLSDSSQDFPTHYKGNFDATTISPALSNVTGVVGDEYKVINGGVNVDFGAGNVFLETDDIIIFYDSQWRVKVSPGIPKSEKGAIDGVATLDANGKLTASELPDLAITDVIVAVETTIALFAANSGSYVFQQGDVIILDNGNGGFYIYKGGTKTDVASYSEISASEVDWSQVVNTPTTIGGYGITDFNSLGDARWLLLSSYTAADVLAKILTVDGSGSGLDADLLRGVHWGNVNTNIVTIGTVRGASNSGINGTGTGVSNMAFFAFYESDGTTEQGYIGFPTSVNSHLYLRNTISGKQIILLDSGGLTYNGQGSFTGTLIAAPATLSTELVTKGQLDTAVTGVDAATLDGIDSSQFLRSDVADQKTSGDLLFYNDVEAEFGNTNPMGISGNDTINTIRLASKNLQITDNLTQRFLFARSTGNFTATGTATATNFILSSDIRLKKKIKSIGSIWKSFFMDGKKRYGVIAQEVEVDNPELVYENEKGFKSVAYIDLLCKKMAEKDKQIESLEKRIAKLEKLL